MLANLKDHRIILASQSPRRQELLRMAEVDFEVAVIPGLEESFPTLCLLNRPPNTLHV